MSDTNEGVLHWPGKLFSADDLRRHWRNQRELVLGERTLLTPLVLDELRARGVTITRQQASCNGASQERGGEAWVYVAEENYPDVAAAAASLQRQGTALTAGSLKGTGLAAWLTLFGDWRRQKQWGVVFGADAALLGCVANKAGLRAAPVCGARQAKRALTGIGANALIVEMPGPTFFEIRQILASATAATRICPPEIDKVLTELDAHAHH